MRYARAELAQARGQRHQLIAHRLAQIAAQQPPEARLVQLRQLGPFARQAQRRGVPHQEARVQLRGLYRAAVRIVQHRPQAAAAAFRRALAAVEPHAGARAKVAQRLAKRLAQPHIVAAGKAREYQRPPQRHYGQHMRYVVAAELPAVRAQAQRHAVGQLLRGQQRARCRLLRRLLRGALGRVPFGARQQLAQPRIGQHSGQPLGQRPVQRFGYLLLQRAGARLQLIQAALAQLHLLVQQHYAVAQGLGVGLAGLPQLAQHLRLHLARAPPEPVQLGYQAQALGLQLHQARIGGRAPFARLIHLKQPAYQLVLSDNALYERRARSAELPRGGYRLQRALGGAAHRLGGGQRRHRLAQLVLTPHAPLLVHHLAQAAALAGIEAHLLLEPPERVVRAVVLLCLRAFRRRLRLGRRMARLGRGLGPHARLALGHEVAYRAQAERVHVLNALYYQRRAAALAVAKLQYAAGALLLGHARILLALVPSVLRHAVGSINLRALPQERPARHGLAPAVGQLADQIVRKPAYHVGIYHKRIVVGAQRIVFVLPYFVVFARMSAQVNQAQPAQRAHAQLERAHFVFIGYNAQKALLAIFAAMDICLRFGGYDRGRAHAKKAARGIVFLKPSQCQATVNSHTKHLPLTRT